MKSKIENGDEVLVKMIVTDDCAFNNEIKVTGGCGSDTPVKKESILYNLGDPIKRKIVGLNY